MNYANRAYLHHWLGEGVGPKRLMLLSPHHLSLVAVLLQTLAY